MPRARYAPDRQRLLTLLVGVAIIVAFGLVLDGVLVYVLALAVVGVLLALDALATRSDPDPSADASADLTEREQRLHTWVTAPAFLAALVAAGVVNGSGERVAAFAGAFLVVLALSEAAFALYVNRRA